MAEAKHDEPLRQGLLRGFCALVALLASIGQALAALSVLLAMLMIGYGVLMRYVAGTPITWVDSIVSYLLVLIVMLGSSAALRSGQHISVDVLTEQLPPRGRAIVHLWAMGSVLLVGGYLAIDGWNTAMFSKMLGIMTSGYLEIPLYWLQLLLPLGGILLCLAALESVLRLALAHPTSQDRP